MEIRHKLACFPNKQMKMLYSFNRLSGVALAQILPHVREDGMSGLDISNKPSFRQEHPGVSDGPDGSDGTSYPLTENHTRPVA
jgi:hypothetical protein